MSYKWETTALTLRATLAVIKKIGAKEKEIEKTLLQFTLKKYIGNMAIQNNYLYL